MKQFFSKLSYALLINFIFFDFSHSFANSLSHDIQEVDNDNDWDTSDNDDEGQQDQKEVREKFHNGFAAAVGEALPWQLYSVEMLHQQSTRHTFGFFAGGGHFSRSSTQPLRNKYDVETDVFSFGGSYRFYLSEMIPVASVTHLSLGMMNGKLSPRSNDVDEATKTSGDFISSSFRSNFISFATGLGVTYCWQNGVFLDWNIIAAQKSVAFGTKVQRDSSERQAEAKRFIEQPKLYGVINLAVGYFIN